jgi:hypothetical protein
MQGWHFPVIKHPKRTNLQRSAGPSQVCARTCQRLRSRVLIKKRQCVSIHPPTEGKALQKLKRDEPVPTAQPDAGRCALESLSDTSNNPRDQ